MNESVRQAMVEQARVNDRGATSMKINGEWYSGFLNGQTVNAGDCVSFEYYQKGKYKNIKGRVTVEQAPAQQQQAAPATAPSSVGGRSSDTQIAIQYQASRKDGLQMVEMLLAAGMVQLPAKKAEQQDAVAALVDDFTNRYYCETSAVVQAGGVLPSDLEQALGTPEEDF